MTVKKIKDMHICFVAPFAYSIISGKGFEKCGGAEIQQYLIASNLKKKAGKISFIIDNKYYKKKAIINGFHIEPCSFKYFGGSNKYYIKDTIKLISILHKLKPDYILLKTPRVLLFSLAIYRKLFGSKLIKLGAGDSDFNLAEEWYGGRHERILYKLGLKSVDHFVYQSNYQMFLAEKIGLNGDVIYNIAHNQNGSIQDSLYYSDILWVGKSTKRKNPELFLEIAQSMPNHNKFIFRHRLSNFKKESGIVS